MREPRVSEGSGRQTCGVVAEQINDLLVACGHQHRTISCGITPLTGEAVFVDLSASCNTDYNSTTQVRLAALAALAQGDAFGNTMECYPGVGFIVSTRRSESECRAYSAALGAVVDAHVQGRFPSNCSSQLAPRATVSCKT